MRRHGTRDHDHGVRAQQGIAETLLSGTRRSSPQPVSIRHIGRPDDMNVRRINDPKGCQNVRDGVEDIKTLVHRDLDDGGRRIQAGVEDAGTFSVPAAAEQVSPFA